MLKYLLVFFIILACGRTQSSSSKKTEKIVDSYSFQITNAPGQKSNNSSLNLLEETQAKSYLNIQGQLQLPNIPDEFNKELGCLDVSLNDETFTNYASSLVVSTTGLIGQTFPSVSIHIFMLKNQERVLLDPSSPTTIDSFAADSVHLSSIQICFEIEYSEVPLQIYVGNINIQYMVESDELQDSDCSLNTDPTFCTQEAPSEIPQGSQDEDAEVENDDETAGDSGSSDGDDAQNENGESGDADPQNNGEDAGGASDSDDANNEDSTDNESEGEGGQDDEPAEDDTTGEEEENSEDVAQENEPSDDGDVEVSQDPADDDLESRCEVIAIMQGNESLNKSGSYFLEANKYKITGNKTTIMFYLGQNTLIEDTCLFLAGNQSNAQVIVDGSIGSLFIIGRGNSASTTVLVNEGASIGNIAIDFAGNNPQLSVGGAGNFNCPDEPEHGMVICE